MNTKNQKIIAALYLRGEFLDPQLVTKSIGVEPSRAQKKDDVSFTSTGHKVVAKLGLWALIVELDSSSLDNHIKLLAELLPFELSYSSIVGVEEAYVDIFVAMASDADGDAYCTFELSPRSLDALARLKLPFHMTITVGHD